MFTIIRLSIALISIIIAILIVLRTVAKKKKWVYLVIILGGLGLYTFTSYLPIENVVTPFSSPENAFHYWAPNEVVSEVFEGKDSALVVGDIHKLAVKRLRNGWGFFSCSASDTYKVVVGKAVSTTINYSIYRVPWTTDYYLYAWSTKESFTIEDSMKNEYCYFLNDRGDAGYFKTYGVWCHFDRIEAD